RAGGWAEDLWAFNELPVAEAIWHASVPVVTGVGHETDVTLADLVADHRAHTPTHAAPTSVARATTSSRRSTARSRRSRSASRAAQPRRACAMHAGSWSVARR